jgi:hypothetical protein
VNSWAQLAGFTSSSDVRINNDDANLQLEATSGSPVLYFQDGNTDDTFGRVAYSTSSDVMYMKNDSSNLYVWLGDDGVIRFRHGSTDWATLVDSAFTTDSVDVRALRADTVHGGSPVTFMDPITVDTSATLNFSYVSGADTAYTYDETSSSYVYSSKLGVIIVNSNGATIQSVRALVSPYANPDVYCQIQDADGNPIATSVETYTFSFGKTDTVWTFDEPVVITEDSVRVMLIGDGQFALYYDTSNDPGTGYFMNNTTPDPAKFPEMTVSFDGGMVYESLSWDGTNSELDMPAIHPSAINTPMGAALTDTIVTAGGDSIMISNGLIWKWVVGP